jgi:hypothetical protein
MNKSFDAVHALAHEAGMTAGINACPLPMLVTEDSARARSWLVDEGACGFAWVVFKGNTAWGRWAKKQGIARSHYPSGLCVWVSEFGQSVARKEAYAYAYALVLKENGIDAYSSSRLD